MVSSDLERAQQTAAPIAEALGLVVRSNAALRERRLGTAEGAPVEELAPAASGVEHGLVVDADCAPPGGETVRDFYHRVVGFAEAVLASSEFAGDLVVVTHGGVVRVLQAWSRGRGPEDMTWGPVGNGQVLACDPPVPGSVCPSPVSAGAPAPMSR
jgi:probable phosphoglycerate mutase